jgi:hypothetical protein
MKRKTKPKRDITGSVRIVPEVYTKAKEYCDKSGVKIQTFVTNAVNDKLAICYGTK